MTDYSYIGSGRIYAKKYGSAAPLIELGNCSALKLAVTEDTKEQIDHTQPGGGTYNEVRRVSSVEATITEAELSPENLARALFGTSSAVVSAPVTNEEHPVYKGGLIPFDNLPDTTVDPSVDSKAAASAATRANTTAYGLNSYIIPASPNDLYYKVTTGGTSGASPPAYPTSVGGTVTDGSVVLTCMGRITLVKDDDYVVRPGGIFLQSTAKATEGEIYQFDYTKVAANIVEALTGSAADYTVVFDGLNEARSGKQTRVTIYRMKFGAAQNVDLIGDDYASLDVSGKLQKDTTIVATGKSQYFKTEIAA